MKKCVELTEDELMDVSGGRVGVNFDTRTVTNSSTGATYSINEGYSALSVSMEANSFYKKQSGSEAERDKLTIEHLQSLGYI